MSTSPEPQSVLVGGGGGASSHRRTFTGGNGDDGESPTSGVGLALLMDGATNSGGGGGNRAPPTVGRLLREMLALAVPITVSTAAQFSVVTVNLSFVGRLGVAELGGAATGVMITNSTAFAVATGLCGALDTMLSQIHGANPNDRRYGRETQRMACMLLCLSLPIALLWWNVGTLLTFIGQPAEVVHHTSTFVRLMLPGLPAILGLEVLKRYMQAQHITFPITVAVFAAAVGNPIVLGFTMDTLGLGFLGSPVGWCIVLLTMASGLLAYLMLPSNAARCAQTWAGVEWGSAWSGWKPLLRLGLPCLGITMAEWTTFELNGVAASFTNPTDLAAYSITNQIATLAWTVISGLASAICVVVGNAVGGGNVNEAKRSAVIGMCLVAAVSLASAVVIVSRPAQLAALFTDDRRVQGRVSDLSPILAIYQFLDALVSAVNAIARGIGRQRFVALFTSFSLLCLGVPIGMTMAFKAGQGVGWLMLGPTLGIGFSLIVYAFWFANLNWREVVPSIDSRAGGGICLGSGGGPTGAATPAFDGTVGGPDYANVSSGGGGLLAGSSAVLEQFPPARNPKRDD